MILNNNDTLIFLGDSVTDCGRDRDYLRGSLGDGYAYFTANYFNANYPQNNFFFINKGISGNTSRDILKRLQDDVLCHNPNIITLCIGINDIWRRLDAPLSGDGVMEDEYAGNLDKICNAITQNGSKLIILSPYFLDTNKEEYFNTLIGSYVEISKTMADKYNLPFIDLHALFQEQLKSRRNSYSLSGDRVHPSAIGHTLIAQWLAKKIEG